MKTISGNTYNIVETRTPTETIWSAVKTSKKSHHEQVKALEAEFEEIKKLVKELTDSGEIANIDFDFLEDDEDEDIEDKQAVLCAAKNLDFDHTVEMINRKGRDAINGDNFEHYIKTHNPGKTVKSAKSFANAYHVLPYHHSRQTNSGDKFLIQMGGTIEPTKETRRASRNPVKTKDDLLIKLGGRW